ncbi:MAG: amidohydrolase [Acidobacteriota bacterium]|nr:amidohydrolase [Acidobacteriota bacterium]
MKSENLSRIGFVLSVGLLLILTHCSSPTPDALAPDLILHNARIVTVDGAFSVAQAVAIKNGRFLAVGSDSDIVPLAGPATETMDLEGKTVMPGLHDSHIHLAQRVGEPAEPLIAKLSQSRSIADIVDVVRQKVEKTEPGKLVWLLRGPRVAQIEEKRWPNRHDFDPVSPDNPVIVTFAGDYVNVANTLALKAAGVDRNVDQPYKRGGFGEFELDPRTGDPTGVVIGKGAHRILREGENFNVWPSDMLETNIARALDEAIAPAGITNLSDPLTATNNLPSHHAYQRLSRRQGGLPARINLMVRIPIRGMSAEECIDLIDSLIYSPPYTNDFLRVGTFKMSLDKGVPGGEPYIVPKDRVIKVIVESHRQGWQLYLHITNAETFDNATEAMEEAYRLFPREDVRHVFTHINMPTEENLEVMKRLGIVADLQVHNIYRMSDDIEERYQVNPDRPDKGPKPVGTYHDAGIPVILSSDQAPLGPMLAISAAVNRVRRSGKVFQPEERLTLEEAIRAVTSTSAWAFHQEDVNGSIEVGKFADLVVLGRDILTVDSLQIKDIPILMTITHGRVVYTNPNQDPNQKVEYITYPIRTSYLD